VDAPAASTLAVPQGEVRFENVSFGYGESKAGHRQFDGTRWRKSA
jgi:hypothetical protein